MENGNHVKNLYLEMDQDMIAGCFTALFSKGVAIRASLACNLKELLCEQVGVAPEYLDNRIQTVFLDGQPVDDVDKAIVENGATIALSAAMPGLVGAVLRKGGTLAGLRKGITYCCGTIGQATCYGSVTVKLFNMTTREVGPLLLKYGIMIQGDELLDIIGGWAEALRRGCREIRLDDRSISIEATVDIDRRERHVSFAGRRLRNHCRLIIRYLTAAHRWENPQSAAFLEHRFPVGVGTVNKDEFDQVFRNAQLA